jgi:hypothetical protein
MKKIWALLCIGAFMVVGCGERSNVLLDAAVNDDTIIESDGPIITQDGPITNPDGPIVNNDGPITNPDAPYSDMIFFDAPVPPPDGPVVPPPDGPVVTDTAPPPPNDTCANAKQLTMSGGKVSVSDDTSPYTNEYGTAINCGGSTTSIMAGKQLYYKVALTAGKTYQVSMASKYYYGRFYVFTGCGVSKINGDCGSGGKTGDVSGYIANNQTGNIIFKPATSGSYYVAVDSTNGGYSGGFMLTIQEYTSPTNDTCSKAKTLVVPAGGSVTEIGSTLGAANEFSTGINCGHTFYTFHGSQLYYKVAMTAGKTYRITLDASYYYAAAYVFGTTCTMGAINAACSSSGATGAYAVATSPSQNAVIQFTPTTSGTYTIAVDSRPYSSSYASAGSFELTIEDFTPPTNNKCTSPKTLTLTGGKVTVKGTTTSAGNEFGTAIRCGMSATYAQDGEQVYYALGMTAGKTYKISLKPTFYAHFYLFNSACNAPAINASCGSGGATGDVQGYVYPNNTGVITFTAKTSGTWKIAVDSVSPSYGGAFELSIEEYVPPTNYKCTGSKVITMSGGKGSVTANTTGMANEFGTGLTCGWYAGAFDGPQLYYHVVLAAGKTYKIIQNPGYTASRFYVFGNTCVMSTINSHCGSNGASGLYAYGSGTNSFSANFKPPATGTYRIGVDSSYATYQGPFTLEIHEYVPPKNATCANAQTVALSSGTTTITGDTSGLANEFGTAINCGGGSQSIMRAPQLYYKLALTAGKTYTFTLTASYYYKRLYIFGTTCTWNAINADCGSGGTTGVVSASSASSTQPAVVSFKPTTSGTYTVAVDGTYTSTAYNAGPFTLKIQ